MKGLIELAGSPAKRVWTKQELEQGVVKHLLDDE